LQLLVLSIAALFIGPAIHRASRHSSHLLAAIDGFTLVSVAGLVLLHVLPDAAKDGGVWAIALAMLGFFLPSTLERWLHDSAETAHNATLVLALFGLTLHGMMDGAGLAQPHLPLAIAVVMHRLPVGLAIWLLLVPRGRLKTALLMLGLVAASTVVGYAGGGALIEGMPSALAFIQGLVAGALMHVVIHRHAVKPPGGWQLGAGLGAIVGIALVAYLGHDHSHDMHEATVASTFIALAKESAWPLLIAYLGASLLEGFLPRATVRWMARGSHLSRAMRGMAFGLPLPICSCGVVPLYRGLVQTGVPAAAGMSFLVATPEIGVDAVLLSLPLLGSELTIARVAAAGMIALAAGYVIGRFVPDAPITSTADKQKHRPVGQRLVGGLRSGLGGLVDNTAAWILVGLAIAAVGSALIDPTLVAKLPAGLDIVVMAALGIPVYVCASGATPLVAMLVAKGVSPGAALAFLLTGPATNATTFGVLSRLHGPKIALGFGILVGGLAIACGLAVNALVPSPDVFTPKPHGSHESSFQTVGLLLLTGLYGFSLLRQGPRRFIAHVFRAAHDYDHDHNHSHDHHDHHDHDHHDDGDDDNHGCCHHGGSS
jgi:uncharacterized membrane protein YraQ (UPF0718 family)